MDDMLKRIDISRYLKPASERDDDSDDLPPKHDPTYSALLGYGFKRLKLLKPEPRPDKKER